MDIWKWVNSLKSDLREAGNTRLAQLIEQIPPDVCYGRLELAQAALAEAVAGARAINNPWLEVFFRHWIANGRVSRHDEGESALKDMVTLFEFSHRPETIGCPQSVCTTQDIAICYGTVDGPGYAAERVAVCEETLARIDPSWACFACISSELVEAHIDAGRADDAVSLARQQMDRIQREGGNPDDLKHTLAWAMAEAGQWAEALELLEWIEAQRTLDGSIDQRHKRASLRFLLLARLGRYYQAWEALPAESDSIDQRDNDEIAAGLALVLAALPHLNDFRAGRRTARALRRYSQIGAHRITLAVAQHHVRLAVARGARWSAQLGLDIARAHLPKLRMPLGAPEQFAQLEALVAAMPPAPPPDLSEARLAALRDAAAGDPEHAIDQMLPLAPLLPADPRLAGSIADAMRACGAAEQAREHMWQFVCANPDQFDMGAQLLAALIGAHDRAGVVALADTVASASPALASWCRARLAYLSGRWEEAAAHAEQVLVRMPESDAARRLWADAAMRLEQFDQALALRLEVAHASGGDPVLLREALIAASAAQRGDIVRELAHRLGMRTETGDPAHPPENINLEFDESSATCCRRIGPATAHVLEISTRSVTQRAGDLVVFDPAPLDECDPASYRAVHTLKHGGFGTGYRVSGVAPDEDAIVRLHQAFDVLGWTWFRHSDADEEVVDTETGETLPGLSFVIAAPAGVAPAVIDNKLNSVLGDDAKRMCWPRLASDAGVDADLHWAVMERYDL